MLLLFLFSGCGKQPPLHQDAPLKENRIIIPLADVADKKAHFFSYRKAGKRINFFVRTDSTGVVSAYYDACFTCYRHKKGYRQEGAALICNECSMKFGLFDKKWEEKDGCNPIYLKSAVEGNNLIIDADVIEKGAKLF